MSQRGSAAVLLVAVAGFVLLLTVALGAVGVCLRARVEAVAAADAAALAAAPVTFAPFGAEAGPTEEAARFAVLNGARLVECDCPVDSSWEPRIVTVRVARDVELWPVGSVAVTAVARAEFLPALMLVGD
jgi:secretion/DNA translocation related TadE-like protein